MPGLSPLQKKYSDKLFASYDKETTGLMSHGQFGKLLLLVDPEAEEGEVNATFDQLMEMEKEESASGESGNSIEDLLEEVGHATGLWTDSAFSCATSAVFTA